MASERQLRSRVLATGVLVVVAFVGESAYDSWRLHEQIVLSNTRELSNLSRSLAVEAARNLASVDAALRDSAALVEQNTSIEPSSAVAERLSALAQRTTPMGTLSIVDASGKQVYRSRSTGTPLTDVSDRPYFIAQKATPDAGMFIGEPLLSRTEGVEALIISRRLDDHQGRFAGVVTATLTLAQLRAHYRAINLDSSSTLTLALGDGTLVMRQPPGPVEEHPMKWRELVAMRAGAPIHRMVSYFDGRPKLIAAIGVGKSPLILAVSRDEGEALRPWVDEMWSAAIRTVLLTLVTALTTAGVMRQLRVLESSSSALRLSESRYAMAMDVANEGHAEWNLHDDTLFISAKWRELHGLGQDEDIPNPAALRQRLAIHPDDVAAVQAAIEDHFANRTRSIDIDYRVQLPDGAWRWIHSRGRCLREAGDAPKNLFCWAIDVSDRKRADAETAALEARMQQALKLEALGTLSGGIAHDFNNILGAILGFGEMAQQKTEPGTALRRHIDHVMQSGARARLLVKRILDFSRSSVAERTLVNVRGVVEEVVAMLAPTLPPGVVVQAHFDSGDAAVIGDPTQLHQVVMNLASNAAQSIRDEGRIRIDLRRRTLAGPRAFLQGNLDAGDYACLEICDTGTGISPEVLARMFDPFFTTKKRGEGTGLGLSVVHGIVASMGGAIDVSALAEGGTCVAIWLSVAGELHSPGATSASEWPVGNGEVVMVVDDEAALVELAEELLASLGYEPVGFASAEAAMAAWQADPDRFDAVLTDQLLPGMPGSELAQRFLQTRPTLPIILMSGNLTEAAERSALASGIRATLHKPLALQELAEQLAAVFPRA